MINRFKTSIAMLLAFVFVIAVVGCGSSSSSSSHRYSSGKKSYSGSTSSSSHSSASRGTYHPYSYHGTARTFDGIVGALSPDNPNILGYYQGGEALLVTVADHHELISWDRAKNEWETLLSRVKVYQEDGDYDYFYGLGAQAGQPDYVYLADTPTTLYVEVYPESLEGVEPDKAKALQGLDKMGKPLDP